jgi:hypothetical protein
MKKIFKYDVPGPGCFKVEMPRGAEILSVQTQRGEPVFWALVEPGEPLVARRLACIATGEEIDLTDVPYVVLRYVGTFQLEIETSAKSAPSIVMHLFDGGEAPVEKEDVADAP